MAQEVGLKSNHTLAGYSHKFCATTALAYFAGKAECSSKFCGCVDIYLFEASRVSFTQKRLEHRGEGSM